MSFLIQSSLSSPSVSFHCSLPVVVFSLSISLSWLMKCLLMFTNVEAQTERAPRTQHAAGLISSAGRLSAKSLDAERVEGSIAHRVAALDRQADKNNWLADKSFHGFIRRGMFGCYSRSSELYLIFPFTFLGRWRHRSWNVRDVCSKKNHTTFIYIKVNIHIRFLSPFSGYKFSSFFSLSVWVKSSLRLGKHIKWSNSHICFFLLP